MLTVIIDYTVISPAVLATIVERAVSCLCNWKDIDEDYFEFTIFCCEDLVKAQGILAQYV